MSLKRMTRSSTQAAAKAPASSTAVEVTKRTKPVKARSKKLKTEDVGHTIRGSLTAPADAAPSTPPAKRIKRTVDLAPPMTPTPALVSLMATSYSTGDIDDPTPPSPLLSHRLAEPHMTNAPLTTPGGSRLVTYSEDVVNSSPSKTGLPRPTTTTGQLLDEACAHLIKVEPKLTTVIEKYQCRLFSPEGLAEEIDPFRSLSSGIISQQVSGAAATSIKNKFIALFHHPPAEGKETPALQFPRPAQVAACNVPFLRQAGLSGRKAEYIKGLAEKFANGELSAKMLIEASYEEVVEKLTAVRGLGRWSVEMFACFGLKRMDVFSTGDLGIQ
ncbi:MAG: hypothetical protein Q9187_001689 [Circinaria calcarea]